MLKYSYVALHLVEAIRRKDRINKNGESKVMDGKLSNDNILSFSKGSEVVWKKNRTSTNQPNTRTSS